MSDANDWIMGGGGSPSCTFTTVGQVWKGTILESVMAQQVDFATKKPKFWESDGQPMMQAVVTIQTDVRDLNITDDDGKRRLFVKGAMKEAVKQAVIAAGADRLAVGGTIAVQYTGNGTAEKAGMNPPKQYRAEYAPPAVGVNSLIGDTGSFATPDQVMSGAMPGQAPPPVQQPVVAQVPGQPAPSSLL